VAVAVLVANSARVALITRAERVTVRGRDRLVVRLI